MIKNIVFDLGNVFIPLQIQKARWNFIKMGLFFISQKLKKKFLLYEKGKISSKEFIFELKKKVFIGNEKKIIKAWSSIIGDFDLKKFDTLTWAKQSGYRLFLLSNLNEIHLEFIKEKMGKKNFKAFEGFFDKLYFSQQMGLSKPDKRAYEIILDENQILASESLFVDDLEKNILSAKKLNFRTWHFRPKKDLLSQLEKKIILMNIL